MSARHVALLGLTGAGKTTIGSGVALRLERPFLDSDQLMAERDGRTGASIAAERGVAHLHRVEREITAEMLAATGPAVLAIPASAVDDAPTRRELCERALCIWLDADPGVLAARQSRPGHRRPLDAADLAELRTRRMGFLERAALRIDTVATSADAATTEIVAFVRLRQERSGGATTPPP
jgi:shikimate kinase